jgi:hypothetical protein
MKTLYTRTVDAKSLRAALTFIGLHYTELGNMTIKRADLAVDVLGQLHTNGPI